MTNRFYDFIPLPMGQMNMLLDQPLISDLLGQVGYEVRGRDVIFNKDLTAQSPKVEYVDMQLIVADFSKFDDYELLPIDADMQAKVIEMVVSQFIGTPNKPQIVDSTSDTK